MYYYILFSDSYTNKLGIGYHLSTLVPRFLTISSQYHHIHYRCIPFMGENTIV